MMNDERGMMNERRAASSSSFITAHSSFLPHPVHPASSSCLSCELYLLEKWGNQTFV
jgi:hypothetical protein